MSKKLKTSFYCQKCGAASPKWTGQCFSCKEWNTLVEEVIQRDTSVAGWKSSDDGKKSFVASPKKIAEIELGSELRIDTGDEELNRVLGGGIVPGAMVLLGGEPGIGKSTLMLQLALSIKNIRTLYVSGEESERQIRMRAERLHLENSDCYILTETATQHIFAQTKKIKPELLVIDSIQTLHTSVIEASPGSVSQIRECTAELLRYAKESGIPVILIGHLTKDGSLAGPKILEHMVDTVLQFEGDRNHIYRILRAAKNRFGSTAELGIYEMLNSGLREVANPSEILISRKDGDLSGAAIAATLEGMRPMLIEIQALVSTAVYGTPQRSATGFDLRRLNMLLAVLEKRCGFRLGAKDVFLNITGGIKVDDPAIDLGVVCAILSSGEDMPISQQICFSGEIGLSGEIRPSSRIDQRISEAEKLGFESICISSYSKIDPGKYGIKIIQAGKIDEVFELLFR